MAESSDSVIIDIQARAEGIDAKLNLLQEQIKGIGTVSEEASKNAGSSFAGLATKVMAAVYAFKKIYDATVADNQAQLQLRSAIEANTSARDRQGKSVTALVDDYKEFASERQRMVGIADEETMQLMNLLTTYQILPKDMKRIATIAQDMSAATGQSAESIARIFGRLAQAPEETVKGLRRYGLVLDENMIKGKTLAKQQEIIFGELERRYKGQSEAAQEASYGIKGFQAAIGDTMEEIGRAVLPGLMGVVTGLTGVISWLNNTGSAFKALMVIVAGSITVFTGHPLIGFATMVLGLATALTKATISLKELTDRTEMLEDSLARTGQNKDLVAQMNDLAAKGQSYADVVKKLIELNPELANRNITVASSAKEVSAAMGTVIEKQEKMSGKDAGKQFALATETIAGKMKIIADLQGKYDDESIKKANVEKEQLDKFFELAIRNGQAAGMSISQITESLQKQISLSLLATGGMSDYAMERLQRLKEEISLIGQMAKDMVRYISKIAQKDSGGPRSVTALPAAAGDPHAKTKEKIEILKAQQEIFKFQEEQYKKLGQLEDELKAKKKGNELEVQIYRLEQTLKNMAKDNDAKKILEAATKEKEKLLILETVQYEFEQRKKKLEEVAQVWQDVMQMADGKVLKGLSSLVAKVAATTGNIYVQMAATGLEILDGFISFAEEEAKNLKEVFSKELSDFEAQFKRLTDAGMRELDALRIYQAKLWAQLGLGEGSFSQDVVRRFLSIPELERTLQQVILMYQSGLGEIGDQLIQPIADMTGMNIESLKAMVNSANGDMEILLQTLTKINEVQTKINAQTVSRLKPVYDSYTAQINLLEHQKKTGMDQAEYESRLLNILQTKMQTLKDNREDTAAWQADYYDTEEKIFALMHKTDDATADINQKADLTIQMKKKLAKLDHDVAMGRVEDEEFYQQQIKYYDQIIEVLIDEGALEEDIWAWQEKKYEAQQKIYALGEKQLAQKKLEDYYAGEAGQQLQGLLQMLEAVQLGIQTGAIRQGGQAAALQQNLLDQIIGNLTTQGAGLDVLSDFMEQRADVVQGVLGERGFQAAAGTGGMVSVPSWAMQQPSGATYNTSSATTNNFNIPGLTAQQQQGIMAIMAQIVRQTGLNPLSGVAYG